MSLEEVKTTVDQLATAWEAFKKKNDEELTEIKKKGSADPLITEQLTKINAALDEHKSKLEQVETAAARTHKGGEAGTEGKETAEQIEYKKAFLNYVRKGVDVGLSELQTKALSVGSDPDGGYLVAPQMSSRIIGIVRETSPIRQIATVETISSDSLELLEDRDEADAGWVGETESRPDTSTPQIGKKSIVVHEMFAKPKATQKLLDDASINTEQWLADKIAEKFSRKENTAFVSGNGVVQPRGFLTYADGTAWGQIEQKKSGSNGSFDGDDLIDLLYALKDDYARNSTFLMHRQAEALARKLKDSVSGQYIWQPGLQAGAPNVLLGRPVYQASDLPAPGTNTLSIALGDFRRGYTVVDRLGIRTLRDPYTNKPFVIFYTTKRVGGDVTNFEAIKLLKLGS